MTFISIFVLACFVGYYVVWAVTPAWHTPFMAVYKSISSGTVGGALIVVAAVARRYGSAAMARAEAGLIGREPCERVCGNRRREHYARVLRFLELRLYPDEAWRRSQ